MTQKAISAAEAKKLLDDKNAVLIDVREVSEYEAEHIPGAINMPLSVFDVNAVKSFSPDKKLIIQCLSGKRAGQACARLDNQNASVMEGGIDGWKKAKFETQKKGLGINIQRQVMMVAGSLVLLGSLLTIFTDPNFIALPLFVGAGLLFAGLTGWCGMAMLLGKMSWNK